MNSIPETSGIYMITCTANGKIYIGSSKNLRERCKKHLSKLRSGHHVNQHLQNAYNKYGESAFTFEVLELVMPWCIIEREDYWFKKLKPFGERGFNLMLKANGTELSPESRQKISDAKKGVKRSAESREKMSQAQKGRITSSETKQKMSDAAKGRIHSSEMRRKMSIAMKGRKPSPITIQKSIEARKGQLLSPEHRQKMTNAHRKIYTVTSPEGTVFNICNLKWFCHENDLTPACMYAVAAGNRDHHKGWKCQHG